MTTRRNIFFLLAEKELSLVLYEIDKTKKINFDFIYFIFLLNIWFRAA